MAQPPIKDAAIANNITAGNVDGFSVGVTANDLLQLTGSAQIPAVDGSLLTNMPFLPITGGTITDNLQIEKVFDAGLDIISTSGANGVDEGNWQIGSTGLGEFSISALSDSQIASSPFMIVSRTSGLNVGEVQFNANVKATSPVPTAIDHLTRKDYVDTAVAGAGGVHVGVDDPVQVNVTVQGVTNGAWTTVTVNANAKFVFISGYCFGIFDTVGGAVNLLARKKGLSGVAADKWVVNKIGQSVSSGTNFNESLGGSTLVECNASGQIEVYGYTSSVGTTAETIQYCIKGWVE